LIGLADFALGTEVSLLVFYFIPIALAVVARGLRFGVVIALASVAIWLVGDFAAGAHYANPVVPIWNASIAFITFLVLIWLLARLLAFQQELEERVARRTAALAAEVAERERLEKTILEISERERRSIGHDLHDGLGQHLTGTALTGQLLAERLDERAIAEAIDAKKLVALVESAIAQTRQMAKGLLLADIDAEGLSSALQEFCASVVEQFRVNCAFHGDKNVTLSEAGVASHLYRIAQEAVRNAIRHGRARHIEVHLIDDLTSLTLVVRDDGAGLPASEARGRAGCGPPRHHDRRDIRD
jgi:signal transduction histidine kinase